LEEFKYKAPKKNIGDDTYEVVRCDLCHDFCIKDKKSAI
jgi:hypothetical protein